MLVQISLIKKKKKNIYIYIEREREREQYKCYAYMVFQFRSEKFTCRQALMLRIMISKQELGIVLWCICLKLNLHST